MSKLSQSKAYLAGYDQCIYDLISTNTKFKLSGEDTPTALRNTLQAVVNKSENLGITLYEHNEPLDIEYEEEELSDPQEFSIQVQGLEHLIKLVNIIKGEQK